MATKNGKKEEPGFLDPTHPLFQEFKQLCPGTVKHSLNVAQMVESVSREFDLDVEMMKMAALYHDIGKEANPEYFSENQSETNPHDELKPWVSFQIISRHVSDGVQKLINISEFPREAIQIISQHHGTTIALYFFKKSKSRDDEAFRYFGPVPSSLEAAILMICDSVEATAQSHLFNDKKIDPKKIVNQTIDRLVEDNQLNFMRIGELKLIKELLTKEVDGIMPKRVDYDSEEGSRKQGKY